MGGGTLRKVTWLAVTSLVVVLSGLVGFGDDPARAAVPRIVYTFSGVTFDDGGTLSGSFIYDPNIPCSIPTCHTSGAYSAVSVTTSGMGSGGLADPLTYHTGDLTNATSSIQMWFASSRLLALTFATALGAEGTIAIEPGSVEWTGAGPTRYVTAGGVVGVAEPSPIEVTVTGPTPNPAFPDSQSTLTVTFTPNADTTGVDPEVSVTGAAGAGTLSIISTTAELGTCVLNGTQHAVACDYDATVGGGVQTLVVGVNVTAAATPGAVWTFPVRSLNDVFEPLSATLTIADPATTTTTTTTTTLPSSTTTVAPTSTTTTTTTTLPGSTTTVAPTSTVATTSTAAPISTTTSSTLPVTGPTEDLGRAGFVGAAFLLLGIVGLAGAAVIGANRKR